MSVEDAGGATAEVVNWIDGEARPAAGLDWLEKRSPVDGRVLCRLARSRAADVEAAVAAARRAAGAWAGTPAVQRGLVLDAAVQLMREHTEALARMVAAETGKSVKDARGEVGAAIQLGLFFASEGQRLYGRTTTSGATGRHALTLRQPVGVAGLITAANTPLANVAWKVFPALVCGNAVVLKGAEDTPGTTALLVRLLAEAGVPAGVLNSVQGLGAEAGAPLAAHRDVGVVSFTGSTAVGRQILDLTRERLARVSLELGGKNPLVICDDADLDEAVKWVLLSAFSNAGQRCAAGSRVIVFDGVYETVRLRLVAGIARLRVGPGDTDDLGPVINLRQLERILAAVEAARARGVNVLSGGMRLTGPEHAAGCYLAPTLLEGASADDEVSTAELFGPITALYRARDFAHALELANASPYGLTACIHTRSVHRAMEFSTHARAGVVVLNAGTFGSEPHMPFGGVGLSGNGTREPGTEALDVYSNLKNLVLNVDRAKV